MRIGLPDGNIFGRHALWGGFHLVVIHFWIRRIAEQPLVDEGEMRHVQQIFDRSRSTGMEVIGAAMDFVERWIVPLRKRGNVLCWIAERDPDPIVLFLSLVDFGPRRGRRFLVGVRRKADALPFLVVGPAVIGADQAVVLYLSQREPRSPVQA